MIFVFHRRTASKSSAVTERASTAFGSTTSGESAWAELWILDESRREEARRLIAEFGSPSEGQGTSWRCQNCGEKIEDQFGECWQCGTARPSPTSNTRLKLPVTSLARARVAPAA